MSPTITVRDATTEDQEAVLAFYPLAFPEEDLVGVARDLMNGGDDYLSLVAERDGQVIGHVSYSICGVEGDEAALWLLAPLAVTPAAQKQGVGTALIKEGIARAKAAGASKLLVFGDPNYYGRTGFTQETGVATPYDIPADYVPGWQSIDLDGKPLNGKLVVPPVWQNPSLWGG